MMEAFRDLLSAPETGKFRDPIETCGDPSVVR
jgi:hypothetical protein